MLEPDIRELFTLDPDAVRCPYTRLQRLRDERPVAWAEEIGAFVVTRYDDVMAILRQPDLFSSSVAVGSLQMKLVADLAAEDDEFRVALGRVVGTMSPSLLNADPPLHTRQRSLVNRAFTQRRANDAVPAIRSMAEDLIDRFGDASDVELVSQFAVPLPLAVIADRLGVPRNDLPQFKRWSDAFTLAIGNHGLSRGELREMILDQAEFLDYFDEVVAQRQRDGGDDLVAVIANASTADGEQLSRSEILSMVMQFLAAGNETTTHLIGSAMRMLAEAPDLVARLRRQPEMIAPFVEEVLRLESPVQGPYRRATADVEIGGCPIPAGSKLWLSYSSCNRDERAFPDPTGLDLDRDDPEPILAFGFGAHYCLGAALARVEARVAIAVVLERFERFELREPDSVRWHASYMLRGHPTLRLAFEPALPSA